MLNQLRDEIVAFYIFMHGALPNASFTLSKAQYTDDNVEAKASSLRAHTSVQKISLFRLIKSCRSVARLILLCSSSCTITGSDLWCTICVKGALNCSRALKQSRITSRLFKRPRRCECKNTFSRTVPTMNGIVVLHRRISFAKALRRLQISFKSGWEEGRRVAGDINCAILPKLPWWFSA